MKNLVVLTGAGISAESGIATFRDSNGLWCNHRVEDVATPEGWYKNKQLVLDFYNERRRGLMKAEPNEAHKKLAELQKYFNVTIITQNVDDLHERAGSENVIHLHGELKKARSEKNEELVYDCHADIAIGDLAEDGAQLRPHIVWFGEPVPMIEPATLATETADIFLIVGTSLQVYPAAGLLHYRPVNCAVYLIDPIAPETKFRRENFIQKSASEGMKIFKDLILRAEN